MGSDLAKHPATQIASSKGSLIRLRMSSILTYSKMTQPWLSPMSTMIVTVVWASFSLQVLYCKHEDDRP